MTQHKNGKKISDRNSQNKETKWPINFKNIHSRGNGGTVCMSMCLSVCVQLIRWPKLSHLRRCNKLAFSYSAYKSISDVFGKRNLGSTYFNS